MTDRFNDEDYDREERAAMREAAKGILIAVQPDGALREVPCNYDGIKDGLNDATMDFVRGQTVGVYVDDNGLIEGERLNVPVSLMFGRPIYGPAVLAAADPDAFGNTLAPSPDAVGAIKQIALAWRHVVAGARQIGQDVFVTANADTVPPPTVVAMTDDEFKRWTETGEMPGAG